MKGKLTLEDHITLGRTLHSIRKYMLAMSTQIPNTYGKINAAAKSAAKASRAIDQLRSDLENQLYIDCPPPSANTGIYYPSDLS
jgi:hypothetical protein